MGRQRQKVRRSVGKGQKEEKTREGGEEGTWKGTDRRKRVGLLTRDRRERRGKEGRMERGEVQTEEEGEKGCWEGRGGLTGGFGKGRIKEKKHGGFMKVKEEGKKEEKMAFITRQEEKKCLDWKMKKEEKGKKKEEEDGGEEEKEGED